MTVRVVDLLEAVEIHEQERDSRLRPLRKRERLLGAVVQKQTVGQTGQ
jgi:hypothetical protein